MKKQEANNLMKGDCVFINTYGIIKIIRVTNYMPNGIIGERESATHFAEIKDVTPIPITNRFLINNGFLQVGHLYMFCGTNDVYKYKFIIEYNLSNHTLFINDGMVPNPVQYIHELQHIFRICGLDGNINIDKL